MNKIQNEVKRKRENEKYDGKNMIKRKNGLARSSIY
jgi:hypothetical protein